MEKKAKKRIKNSIIGLLVSGTLFSLIPNIKYGKALIDVKNNAKIVSLVEDEENRVENMKFLYESAVENNDNIPDKIKDLFIHSFEESVIEPYGELFTEEGIYNMIAVVSTEHVSEMSDLAKNCGWYDGNYSPYFNWLTLCELDDEEVISHEQVHAVLKSGLFTTGFATLLKGYGINEALTVSLGENDYSYNYQSNLIDSLGVVIGYDKLYAYFLNRDLDGLKDELEKYLSKEEATRLISMFSIDVFREYFYYFLDNNNIPYSEEKMAMKNKMSFNEFRALIKKIYEVKNNCQAEDTFVGRELFYKQGFLSTDAYDPDVSSFFFCYGGPGKVIVMYFPERESTFGFSDLYFYIGKVPADDIENINKEQFMQENEKVYTFRRDSY